MKNIKEFIAKKYETSDYLEIESGIFCHEKDVVTSLCFQQEIELGEGSSSKDISQYPLEDVLDEFYVYVSDFFPELNDGSDNTCVLEFCSSELDDIKRLRSIIGKHVYNRSRTESGAEYIELIIE